jgi:hypothetical protein
METIDQTQDQLYEAMQEKRDALLAVATKIEALQTAAAIDGMPDWLQDSISDLDYDLCDAAEPSQRPVSRYLRSREGELFPTPPYQGRLVTGPTEDIRVIRPIQDQDQDLLETR